MADDLRKHQLRLLQYTFVDGTFEFMFSALCLLFAIFLYVQSVVPDSLLSTILFVVLFILVIPGGIFLIDLLVRRIKERVTYPRTGYIVPRRPPEPTRATKLIVRIGIPILVAIILALLVIYRPLYSPIINRPQAQGWGQTSIWMLFSGLTFGGIWILIAWRIALPRFYFVGGAILLTGFILPFIGLGSMPGLVVFFGLSSLILFASGSLTLWKYLHSTRPPEDASPAK